MNGYVDMFLLPVPKKNLKAYQKISTAMGKAMLKYGALEYREFLGDNLAVKGMTSFTTRVKPKAGEAVVAAIIGFTSKAHRDKVNKLVMNDPAVLKMIQQYHKNPLADMKRMSYGGFKTFVQP